LVSAAGAKRHWHGGQTGRAPRALQPTSEAAPRVPSTDVHIETWPSQYRRPYRYMPERQLAETQWSQPSRANHGSACTRLTYCSIGGAVPLPPQLERKRERDSESSFASPFTSSVHDPDFPRPLGRRSATCELRTTPRNPQGAWYTGFDEVDAGPADSACPCVRCACFLPSYPSGPSRHFLLLRLVAFPLSGSLSSSLLVLAGHLPFVYSYPDQK
jgi:hypothetical protein